MTGSTARIELCRVVPRVLENAPVRRLNLRLLVHAQNDGVLRRRDKKSPRHRAPLPRSLDHSRVERLHPMGLQSKGRQTRCTSTPTIRWPSPCHGNSNVWSPLEGAQASLQSRLQRGRRQSCVAPRSAARHAARPRAAPQNAEGTAADFCRLCTPVTARQSFSSNAKGSGEPLDDPSVMPS